MIKESTVFIFGAGLSSNYYFPTGAELRDEITNLLRFSDSANLPQQIKVLRRMGFTPDQITDFREQLEDGGFDTIDEFLEKRKSQAIHSLGKIAIAMALITHENPNLLSKNKSSDTCFYRFLFKKMVADTEKGTFAENPVSFVTFNYDRSFEFYLWRALSKYYEGIHPEEVNNIMKKLRIIHVHGKLGDLPWESPNSRAYSMGIDEGNLVSASNGIVNFNDIGGSYERYKKARYQISVSSKVYFIGFGFHNLNLSRLIEEGCLDGNKTILATALGITSTRVKEIDKLTNGKLNSGNMINESAIAFAHSRLILL